MRKLNIELNENKLNLRRIQANGIESRLVDLRLKVDTLTKQFQSKNEEIEELEQVIEQAKATIYKPQ